MVLVISLVLTTGITYLFYKSAKNKDLIRFNNEVDRVQFALENKINLCLAALKGGRGFIESTKELTRKNFVNYVNSLELDKNFIGVQGIGYNKIVLPDERETLINQMKSEGYDDFKLFPEGERDIYQAIIYLEPLNDRNKRAIGYDMSTETNRREALEKARDTGEAVVSTKVTLLQEDEKEQQAGFLIYLPVYKNGEIPSTIEERRKNLQGFTYSPVRATEFLKEVQNKASAFDLIIKIYDGEANPANLLAETESKDSNAYFINEEFQSRKVLNFAGRDWALQYNTLNEFIEQSSVGWTPLIFLSGLVFSALFFGLTFWETSTRAKLQTTAAELLELEKQQQILLEKEHQARLTAEKANRSKDEFIAVVSHELRTPLNAIAGWTRILQTESLSAKTKNLALGKIEKNLRAQIGLVDELLEYSQIIAGNIKDDNAKLNFAKLFDATFQEVEPSAREKEIEMTKDNKLENHSISGNEEKIKLVISNLLSNAVKFTPNGGKIEASTMVEDGKIKMIVKDNGKGISPEYLPHIFERFEQADNSITRTHGGLGLGLAITFQIVKIHNGTIEAESEGINKGSVFTVKIPLV